MKIDRMSLTLHRDPEDLASLKEEWRNLLERSGTSTVFQTWEWNSLWWKHFGCSGELLLLTGRNAEGRLIGIAPLFCRSDESDGKRIEFMGGTDLSDYLDFIADLEEEALFYSGVARYLIEHPELWDSIDLHCLPGHSATLKTFKACFRDREFRESLWVEDVCPRTELPRSWEEFLAGLNRKDRHEIKRKMNRMRREVGDLRYRSTPLEEFQDCFESFVELHRKSSSAKMIFMNPQRESFFKDMARVFLHAGWLELSFLEAGPTRLACLMSFTYGNTVYVYNSGYNPEFSSFSPGWVLIGYSIQHAIESKVKHYDFLRGNEPYKYHFGAKDFPIYRYAIQPREADRQ